MGKHGKHRALVAAALMALAAPAVADCRLALALALDVSSSVDARDYDLQRLGLAGALDAPEVRQAILPGPGGYVALSVYEWSGHHQQKLHLDWTVLRSPADIDRAVAVLLRMRRSHETFPTSIGQALAYGGTLMQRAPTCTRRVIDISGDGVHNHGDAPEVAYQQPTLGGVTVNGLVILGDDPGVLAHYLQEVLHGPDAFLISANGFDDYRAAMERKLLREVSLSVVGVVEPEPTNIDGQDG